MKRHPANIAFDKWCAENPETLGGEPYGKYLRNRLSAAFNEGWCSATAAMKDATTEPVEAATGGGEGS